MALLSGLGQALGQAAIGAQRGQLLGAQTTLAQQRLDDQNDYKKHVLKLKQAELKNQLTPTQKVAQAYLQDAGQKLLDPKFVYHLQRNPEADRKFHARVTRAQAVMEGRSDSFDLLEHDDDLDGMPDQGTVPGQPGTAAPAGNPYEAQDISAQLAMSPRAHAAPPGMSIFDAERLRQPAAEDPLGLLARGPSSYEPLTGIGGNLNKPLSMAGPTPGTGPQANLPANWRDDYRAAPAAAPKPKAPAAKPSAMQRYEEWEARGRPSRETVPQEPGEPEDIYADRLKSEQESYDAEGKAIAQNPKVQAAVARAGRTGELLDSQIGVNTANAGLAGERTITERETRPGKVQNYASLIESRRQSSLNQARGLSVQERQLQLAKDLGWARLQVERAKSAGDEEYRQARIAQIHMMMDHIDDPNQRARLSALTRLYTGTTDMLSDPILGGDDRDEAGEEIDSLMEAMGGSSLGLGKGTPSPKSTPNPKPKSAPRASVRAETRGGVTYQQFYESGKARGKTDVQIKQQWGRMPRD